MLIILHFSCIILVTLVRAGDCWKEEPEHFTGMFSEFVFFS